MPELSCVPSEHTIRVNNSIAFCTQCLCRCTKITLLEPSGSLGPTQTAIIRFLNTSPPLPVLKGAGFLQSSWSFSCRSRECFSMKQGAQGYCGFLGGPESPNRGHKLKPCSMLTHLEYVLLQSPVYLHIHHDKSVFFFKSFLYDRLYIMYLDP